MYNDWYKGRKMYKMWEVVSSVEIKELGHDFGSWKTIKQATCTEKGLREGTCSRCSVRKTERNITNRAPI